MTDPREANGRLVHQARRDFEAERSALKDRPGFLLHPWEERHPEQRELDMRMGSVVADVVTASVRGRFGRALREHYLAGIARAGVPEQCNPVCACPAPFRLCPSVGEAVEAWIEHVMEVAGSEEGDEHG